MPLITDALEAHIEDQLRSFYPTRLVDYQEGRLVIKVQVVNSFAVSNDYHKMKQLASITDPLCNIILSAVADLGVLFVAPYLVDPMPVGRSKKEG